MLTLTYNLEDLRDSQINPNFQTYLEKRYTIPLKRSNAVYYILPFCYFLEPDLFLGLFISNKVLLLLIIEIISF